MFSRETQRGRDQENSNNAESVREFQPRVCFETLGCEMPQKTPRNSEGVANALRLACGNAIPINRDCIFKKSGFYPGLPKLNPGLELANAFSVVGCH